MMTNPVGSLSKKPHLGFESAKNAEKLDCCKPRILTAEQNSVGFNGKINGTKPSFSVLA